MGTVRNLKGREHNNASSEGKVAAILHFQTIDNPLENKKTRGKITMTESLNTFRNHIKR